MNETERKPNQLRSGVDRVVIVVGKEDGDKIREVVSRTRAVAEGKVRVEFLEDTGDPARQFHAKSILRARCSRSLVFSVCIICAHEFVVLFLVCVKYMR